jgi:hypothetical protein
MATCLATALREQVTDQERLAEVAAGIERAKGEIREQEEAIRRQEGLVKELEVSGRCGGKEVGGRR